MKSKLPLPVSDIKTSIKELGLSPRENRVVFYKLKQILKEARKQKYLHNLSIYPDLEKKWYEKSIVIGEKIINQRRQRRRINKIYPILKRGAPRYLFADQLVKKLGEIYVRTTGNKPTRGGTSGILSKFERFAIPLMNGMGIVDLRNRVRRYISWRKSQGL